MVTAVSELKAIQKHAENIKNDETHELSVMSAGDAWAQGDVLITCLGCVPAECEPMMAERQLAPGTTQGSRHCIVDLAGVEMFRLKDATPLDGPVFRSDRKIEIDHPEHGNLIVPPGVYGVTYQRQYAEELRRVQD